MRKNYSAWDVQLGDFEKCQSEYERIKFILRFAVLAPSGHNSQPWKFKILQNSVEVYLDESKKLKESDANDRQSYISIGCSIKNIEIAADYLGYEARVNIQSHTGNNTPAATIGFQKRDGTHRDRSEHLIHSISKRTTNRNRYGPTIPHDNFLEYVGALASEDIRIDFIFDRTQKDLLSDIALDAMSSAMDSKGFREELSRYVKHNLTTSKTGMPAFGLGIPTPFSFIVPSLLKFFNMARLSRKQDEALFKKYTPMFVLISTKDDGPRSWIEVGRVFMAIALQAEKEKLSIQPWQAPIQIGDYYTKIQELLGLGYYRPQFFMRVGYALKKTAKSPRANVDDLILK